TKMRQESLRALVVVSCLLLMATSGKTAAEVASGRTGSLTSPHAEAPVPAATRRPDVIYVTTPEAVVHAMLKAVNVTQQDCVYDLGCGEGRIVVTAAKTYGAHGVGIDIDPQRVKEARNNVSRSGVGDRVQIRQQDIFESDLRDASVVALY